MTPLTLLLPKGTVTLEPIKDWLSRFSGTKYVNVWNEDIGNDTSTNIIKY
jgi:hypothetical protein